MRGGALRGKDSAAPHPRRHRTGAAGPISANAGPATNHSAHCPHHAALLCPQHTASLQALQ
jgi:hypothetical protein